ncbi:MAG: hypothetical protein AAFO72_06640 [Pseudomonadota bacterium]
MVGAKLSAGILRDELFSTTFVRKQATTLSRPRFGLRRMVALLAVPKVDIPQPQVRRETRALINRLRFHASFCRASSFLDIYVACQLIDPANGEDAAANTLIRILGQALDKTPVWHRPGEAELSFDELWLAQVIETYHNSDDHSFRFLIHRRIPHAKRRIFGALIANLAEQTF